MLLGGLQTAITAHGIQYGTMGSITVPIKMSKATKATPRCLEVTRRSFGWAIVGSSANGNTTANTGKSASAILTEHDEALEISDELKVVRRSNGLPAHASAVRLSSG